MLSELALVMTPAAITHPPVSVYCGLLQLIWQRAELLNVRRQRLDYCHPGVR
jgi:hypothetical protein